MTLIVIDRDAEKKPTKGRKNKPAKSSVFEAELVTFIDAPVFHGLAEPGPNHVRPILFAVAGSPGMLMPFAANLRLGRPAATLDAQGQRSRFFDLPRSLGYASVTHTIGASKLCVFSLAHLFAPEGSGMIDEGALAFVMAPPKTWIARQPAAPAGITPPDKDPQWFGAMAALLCTFLDTRTPLPVPSDHRLLCMLLRAAMDDGVCVEARTDYHYRGSSRGFHFAADGLDAIGLCLPLAWRCSHDAFAALLSRTVAAWRAGGPLGSK